MRYIFLAVELQDLTISIFFLSWALAWATLALFLWLERGTLLISGAVIVLGAVDLLLLDRWYDYAVMIMGWLALALFIAPRRRHDQLFVARILLSTVYAFGALSKLQPSWLIGDNLLSLAATRPAAAWLEIFLVQPWLSIAATALVATELWMAVGLWIPRTRLITAVIGILLHIALTILATRGGMFGLLHLVALNGGLVLLYPAFWQRLLPAETAERSVPTTQ
ncbi:Vitamin K-dependent gamma-carboxylase [Agrococcus baldri]|uniref:Vitamin K-dependent gamma-carboxylase n=2 Tax=Agrococcus baldri TaxID=153730 RepID=A0AA94HKJ1_9MICO|nr:Vitamin K-dependent gamma-carboxylase [Agrococcus baldri]